MVALRAFPMRSPPHLCCRSAQRNFFRLASEPFTVRTTKGTSVVRIVRWLLVLAMAIASPIPVVSARSTPMSCDFVKHQSAPEKHRNDCCDLACHVRNGYCLGCSMALASSRPLGVRSNPGWQIYSTPHVSFSTSDGEPPDPPPPRMDLNTFHSFQLEN